MKTTLLLVFLTIPYLSFFSQHRTTFNSNGDPLSEIIDPNNMKQGTWSFHNFKGDIVRLETYKDNQLLTRESLVSNTKINTLNYRDIPVKQNFQDKIKQIDSNVSGEFLINANGDIIAIHFYSQIDANNQKLIIDKIKTTYQTTFTNVIITF